MGISGLLPLLKSIHKPTHLRKFAGQSLGVDAYGWLHRGTVSCAIELAQDKPTDKYVEFAMHRVRMLIHFGIKPYLVFDGDYLPSKAATERDRATRRREARKVGLDLLRLGKTSQAHLELQKAVDVTPEMARRLIEELKKANVQYVVAPYEADSQMAYLERKGIINGIISEDSDLLVFGARVLLTKLDQYGECVMIRRDDFTACREISMVGWTDAEFRHMAILSGCDYMDNIAGMGLKTAHRLLRRHKTVDRVVRALQFDGKYKVPADYIKDFEKAERTFLHQWVFCPLEKHLLNLTPVPDKVDLGDMPFIGKHVDAQTASGVATGDLHPHSKEPIVIPLAARGLMARPSSTIRSKENIAQTPDLKKAKSIESFFKPARTPLAELDPNCFTPSPTQQQLLEQQQNNGSWSASPAPANQPRPYLQHPSNRRAFGTPLSQPARRTLSTPLESHNSRSQPAKRMRLCADADLETTRPQPRSPEERSKFFAPPKRSRSGPEESSPYSTRRRKKQPDFNIFSDDSIEDALAELTTPKTHAKPAPGHTEPKNPIAQRYEDGTDVLAVDEQLARASESQSTAVTGSTVDDSQNSRQSLTQATSAQLDSQVQETQDAMPLKGGEVEEADEESAMTTLAPKLKERYTYCTTPSSTARLDPRPNATQPRLQPKPILPQHYSSIRFNQIPSAAAETAGPEIEDSAWLAAESSVLVSDSPPPATSRRTGLNKTGANSRVISVAEAATISTRALLQQGSEDLLVPSSSDEVASLTDADCGEDLQCVPLSPEPADTSSLNLGRFAFTG